MKKAAPLLLTLLLSTPAVPCDAAGVVEDASLFAIVTHKGGMFAGKAHNHLVVASGYRASLGLDADDFARSTFEMRFPTEGLVVDEAAANRRWYPRLEALGLLDEPFSEVSAKDREKIRASMLGKGQLDAASYPEIAARVVRIEAAESTHGEQTFDHRAVLALTVHGKTVEKPVAVRLAAEEGRWLIEAVGSFAFTDFGIEPFSAFLGAVKNLDGFDVFVHLEAEAAPAQPPAAASPEGDTTTTP